MFKRVTEDPMERAALGEGVSYVLLGAVADRVRASLGDERCALSAAFDEILTLRPTTPGWWWDDRDKFMAMLPALDRVWYMGDDGYPEIANGDPENLAVRHWSRLMNLIVLCQASMRFEDAVRNWRTISELLDPTERFLFELVEDGARSWEDANFAVRSLTGAR